MNSSNVRVDIKKIIDLTVGHSESGMINLNLMQSLLYIFAQQLGLLEKTVEFSGVDSLVIKSLMELPAEDRAILIDETPISEAASTRSSSFSVRRTKMTSRSKNASRTSLQPVEEEANAESQLEKLALHFEQPAIETDDDRQEKLKKIPLILEGKSGSESSHGGPKQKYIASNLSMANRMECLEHNLDKIFTIVDELENNVENCVNKIGYQETEQEKDEVEVELDGKPIMQVVGQVSKQISNMNARLDAIADELDAIKKEKHNSSNVDVETKCEELQFIVAELDISLRYQMSLIGEAIEENTNNVRNNNEDLDGKLQSMNDTLYKMSCDDEKRGKGFAVLSNKLQQLQMRMNEFQIILSNKADCEALKTKVSELYFETHLKNIKKTIDDCSGRIEHQSKAWNEFIGFMRQDMAKKTSVSEFVNLKMFVDDQFKCLIEAINTIQIIRDENEAALSRKCLRDVNCSSCDRKSIMNKEETNPQFPIISPVRPGKVLGKGNSKNQSEESSEIGNQLINRYCGGDHTTMTAEKRKARFVKFIKWNPFSSKVVSSVDKVQLMNAEVYAKKFKGFYMLNNKPYFRTPQASEESVKSNKVILEDGEMTGQSASLKSQSRKSSNVSKLSLAEEERIASMCENNKSKTLPLTNERIESDLASIKETKDTIEINETVDDEISAGVILPLPNIKVDELDMLKKSDSVTSRKTSFKQEPETVISIDQVEPQSKSESPSASIPIDNAITEIETSETIPVEEAEEAKEVEEAEEAMESVS